jgi:murein L,D-transpeptidase YafK
LYIASILAVMVPGTSLTAQEKIPDCLLSYRFGPEQHVVVVEKSTQNLFVYSNYNATPVATFEITTGKQNGQKYEEGDLKTPEGIYFFQHILSGDKLPKADDYGDRAFTLNYPNPIDRKERRNGSGIWLHGAFDESKTTVPNNSRGCVVMKNGDLVEVSKYIFLNRTPICIYEKISYDSIENVEKRRDRLIQHLRQWKVDWENKNTDGYISHYDPGFVYQGMGLERFKTYKENLNNRYKFIRVFLSDINIYGFKKYHVVSFNQLYISDINHFYSRKIQYWTNGGSLDNVKIAAETTGSLPLPTKFERSKGNWVTVDQYRREYKAQLRSRTVTFSPRRVYLENVSIRDRSITLSIKKSARAGNLKVIPVLRLHHRSQDTDSYRSLTGITLENGMPEDNSRGVPLNNLETVMVLEKEKELKLKSLTLFLIGSSNELEQIITYIVDKEK